MFSRKNVIIICLLIIFSIHGGFGEYQDPTLQITQYPIISDNYSSHPYTPPKEKEGLEALANETATLDLITGGSQYQLVLHTGWNHVSIPYRLIYGNDTAKEIFGSLTDVSGHSLYRFDAGNWISVLPDEVISPLTSYWVFTGTPASLLIKVDPNQTGAFSRNLTTGWNGFGIIGEESEEAKEVLMPLSDIWSYIVGFNVTTQKSEEPILRGGSGRQNDTRPLLPYQGYWIYVTRNGSYEKNESQNVSAVPTMLPVWPQPLK